MNFQRGKKVNIQVHAIFSFPLTEKPLVHRCSVADHSPLGHDLHTRHFSVESRGRLQRGGLNFAQLVTVHSNRFEVDDIFPLLLHLHLLRLFRLPSPSYHRFSPLRISSSFRSSPVLISTRKRIYISARQTIRSRPPLNLFRASQLPTAVQAR